jgi:hypothetical protein
MISRLYYAGFAFVVWLLIYGIGAIEFVLHLLRIPHWH